MIKNKYQIFFLIMHLLNCLTNATGFEESKKILQDKNLYVKCFNQKGIYLVRYNKDKCDMTDPDVMKCRGLVMRQEDNRVVCYPPSKSVSIQSFLENVDTHWGEVQCEEFVDGTMINIFNHNNEWILSTRSCIGGNNKWLSVKTFKQMFNESTSNFDFGKLNTECCYTVVLKHNDNRIVKEYTESGITLVSARRFSLNEDGTQNIEILNIKEVKESLNKGGIKIDIPEVFTFESYDDAFKACNKSSYQEQGYIFKYNSIRSKVRNTSYSWAKNLRGNTNNLKFLYLQLRQNGALQEYNTYFPEHSELFSSYQKDLFDTTGKLHQSYMDLHVAKKKNIKEIPYEFRPLCYQLHGIYIQSQRPNTFAKVKNFFNQLDPKLQLFTINFKYRPKKEEQDSQKEPSIRSPPPIDEAPIAPQDTFDNQVAPVVA